MYSKESFFGQFASFWYEMANLSAFVQVLKKRVQLKTQNFGLTLYLGQSSLIKALTAAFTHAFLERIIKRVTAVASFEERTRLPELLKSFLRRLLRVD